MMLDVMQVQQAGLVDLDATWFIQIGLFLFLYLLLSLFFFRPYVAFLKRRDEKTRGLRERAQGLLSRALELEASLEAMLAEARLRGMAERRALVEEGTKIRDELVQNERKMISEEVERETHELERQKSEFLARVDAAAKELASLIEERVRLQ